MVFLPFQTSVPSADRSGCMCFSGHHNHLGTCGNQGRLPALSPEMRVLGFLRGHPEKHHSLRTLSEGPREIGFFTLQLPRQPASGLKRLLDIPEGGGVISRWGAGRGLSISPQVPCRLTKACFAGGPQRRLIKKRSVGPLALTVNRF